MTDSVRCTRDSPNAFSCEVQLDSDFETLTCEAAEPPPPPTRLPPSATPAPNPAVSLLVSRVVSRTVHPAPPPPLISAAALATCASSELGIALAAGVKSPILAGLAMLKAALDAGSCLTRAYDEAAARNALDDCAALGGKVVAVEGDKTICEVRESEQ